MFVYKRTTSIGQKRNNSYFCLANINRTVMNLLEYLDISCHIDTVPYRSIQNGYLSVYEQVDIDKGFYFILVTNGTAVISSPFENTSIERDCLIMFTPGISGSLNTMSVDFSLSCLYVEPVYFDTLAAGHILYNQLAQLIGNYHLPVFRLADNQSSYLQKILNLFHDHPEEETRQYREGCIRHLCSLILLEITEFIYKKDDNTVACIKRSSEIFRKFKKLLVDNYRKHHTIDFYARELNISTTYLSRVVKKLTGRTVGFHLSEMICADARKLLESTDMEIKEISALLGFSDQSVFGKFFVRKTGIPPSGFRSKKEKY